MLKVKILIVDDQKDLLILLKEGLFLKLPGSDIITAQNGIEAFQKTLLEKPDLIISDIVMPGKDGTDLAVALKENALTRSIPIIFLTSLKRKSEEVPASSSAGPLIFAKPVDVDALSLKIAEILNL